MMDELFNLPESLSPRMKWMRRHHITITDDGDYVPPSKRFRAKHGMASIAAGPDEVTACRNAAVALKVRTWEELP
jgi:hypothetical protein